MWHVNILTLFPEAFPSFLGLSVVGNALKNKIWNLSVFDIRDYTNDRHKTVDDTPYGGGSGMVMKPDILGKAIEEVFLKNQYPIIYPSPRGKVFDRNICLRLKENEGLNIICGRFEGIDERVIEEYNVHEISIGDFVLSSGDLAALCIIDACVRLLPGVCGDGILEESFGLDERYSSLLEYPHYTKPADWKNRLVPSVLLSGNHAAVDNWRLEQAEQKTMSARPDLWQLYNRSKK